MLSAVIFATLLILYIITITMRRSKIPGPPLLRYTKLHNWIIDVILILGKGDRTVRSLQAKYGPVVRISRNKVLVNDIDGVRDVYAVTHRLNRPVPLAIFHNYGTENLVSIENGDVHHERRKPIRSIYSASAVSNEMTQTLLGDSIERLVSYLQSLKEPIDIRKPIRYALYEFLSGLIYGKGHSMKLFDNPDAQMAMDKDIKYQDGRMYSIGGVVMAFFPHFVMWLRRNKLAPSSISGHFPAGLLTDRIGQDALRCLRLPTNSAAQINDMQSTLMYRMYNQYQTQGPSESVPSEAYILSDCADHFWAGVNTTVDLLVPLIHQLSRVENQHRQHRLQKELQAAGIEASSALPPTSTLSQLAYLDACIKETLRLNPSVPLIMERKITGREEAISVCGHRIPEGMTIGASPFLLGRNKDVYGDDVDEWIPERWLLPSELGHEVSVSDSTASVGECPAKGSSDTVLTASEQEAKEKLRLMKQYLFAFGAGPRMCLGINVAWAAMRAVVAGVYCELESEVVKSPKGSIWSLIWNAGVPKQEKVMFSATR